MLDAHMNIRFGMESELSYDKSQCEKCQSTRTRPHCHCSQSVISKEMLQRFDGAYNTNDEFQERDEAAVSEERTAELIEQEIRRLNKLKEELAKRKTFYNTMKVVYEKDAEKKKKNAESSEDILKESSIKKSKKISSKIGEKRKNPKDDCLISRKMSSSKQVSAASTR